MAGNANSISSHNSLRGSLSENNLVSGIVGTAYNPTYAIVTEAAAQIVLNINNLDYKMSIELKDKNGNHISTSNTIDLPLETMVVNGEYDDDTKEIILTLDNGNEIVFSVADLVAGLQSEITNASKLSSDLVDDTSGNHKFITSSERTSWNNKLDNLVVLSYGTSTWADFENAYSKNAVIYCRASSNSNPASGNQGRMAFMAYVNNPATPTEVEFQYYRSMSSHTASQQGDQVFVYKLNKTGGWSVIVREASSKVVAGSGLTSSYSNDVLTLSLQTSMDTKEDKTNKVTSLSSSSTDTQYPSAKCVYDLVGDISSAIDSINGEVI